MAAPLAIEALEPPRRRDLLDELVLEAAGAVVRLDTLNSIPLLVDAGLGLGLVLRIEGAAATRQRSSLSWPSISALVALASFSRRLEHFEHTRTLTGGPTRDLRPFPHWRGMLGTVSVDRV